MVVEFQKKTNAENMIACLFIYPISSPSRNIQRKLHERYIIIKFHDSAIFRNYDQVGQTLFQKKITVNPNKICIKDNKYI